VTHEREQERRLDVLEAAVKALAAALDMREVLEQLKAMRENELLHYRAIRAELAAMRADLQVLVDRGIPVAFHMTFSDPIPEKKE